MITGQLRFAMRYYGVHPRLQGAFEFLMRDDLNRLSGAYEIDGRNIIAIYQEYETRPTDVGEWKTHNHHIDVQFLVSGEERIGYGRREGSRIIKPYNAKDDYDTLAPIDDPDYCLIKDDGFAILFPEDAHQPRVLSGKAMGVKKICIKVLA